MAARPGLRAASASAGPEVLRSDDHCSGPWPVAARSPETSAPLMHPHARAGLSPPGGVLSKYLIMKDLLAGSTGLEPAASGVTGRRSNQLNYDPKDCNHKNR